MAEVVISEFMDQAAIEGVLGGREVLYDPSLVDSRESLFAVLADTVALVVRNRTQVGADLLEAAPRLKVVGRLGVGLDNIDLDACDARGVAVCPATGANDIAVAEYVIAAALMLLRGAWFTSARVAAGEWPRTELIGREATNKRFGLVGLGAIARETARRASALGMVPVAFDPYVSAETAAAHQVELLEFDALVRTSDVVSLHVPLTTETRGLMNGDALARMKPDAILINAARGGVVDEEALVAALRARRLGGAALDVYAKEPLDALGGARFAGLPNLLLTPHIAGITEESNVRVSRVTAENVLKYLDSKG